MANLNTTQIAQNLLGPCQRVYHQDLTTHGNQPHLKIDKLGAGDFIFAEYEAQRLAQVSDSSTPAPTKPEIL